MKKFKNINKAMQFVSLWIEGTFGENLTYSDFTKYDIKNIKEVLKYTSKVFIVIREHGTQNGNGIFNMQSAENVASEWYDSYGILEVIKNEDKTISVTMHKYIR